MPSYSYTNLKDQIIDTQLYQNTTTSTAIRNAINRAARIVNSEIDLRSAKRVYSTVQKIFDNVYDYVAPTDLKGMAVIDIYPQANRSADTRRFLATPAYFDRKKEIYGNMVAVLDNSFTRTLKACFDVVDTKLTASNFDSLAEDGSWVLFGDGENVSINTDNFITGSGSIRGIWASFSSLRSTHCASLAPFCCWPVSRFAAPQGPSDRSSTMLLSASAS